jgi:DNA repair ATPase RecN
MNILKELETLNKEIVSATREMDQAEGRKTAMTETLKKDFSISPDEVADSLDEINEQLSGLGEKIETKFKALQAGYEW